MSLYTYFKTLFITGTANKNGPNEEAIDLMGTDLMGNSGRFLTYYKKIGVRKHKKMISPRNVSFFFQK